MLAPVVTVEYLHHPVEGRLVAAGVDGDDHLEVNEYLALAVIIQRRDMFRHTADGFNRSVHPPRP
jgi:hypothetical protein